MKFEVSNSFMYCIFRGELKDNTSFSYSYFWIIECLMDNLKIKRDFIIPLIKSFCPAVEDLT